MCLKNLHLFIFFDSVKKKNSIALKVEGFAMVVEVNYWSTMMNLYSPGNWFGPALVRWVSEVRWGGERERVYGAPHRISYMVDHSHVIDTANIFMVQIFSNQHQSNHREVNVNNNIVQNWGTASGARERLAWSGSIT